MKKKKTLIFFTRNNKILQTINTWRCEKIPLMKPESKSNIIKHTTNIITTQRGMWLPSKNLLPNCTMSQISYQMVIFGMWTKKNNQPPKTDPKYCAAKNDLSFSKTSGLQLSLNFPPQTNYWYPKSLPGQPFQQG